MRGVGVILLALTAGGIAGWMMWEGAYVIGVPIGFLAGLFAWFILRGGAYEYRIDDTGSHVVPRLEQPRSVPIDRIESVQNWVLQGGRARVRMFRVHCAGGSLIDLPAGWRGTRKRAEAAFTTRGIPVDPPQG